MLDRLTGQLDLHARALTLRSERQKVLAANIANVDTPNFKARDVDFASLLTQAMGNRSGANAATLPLAAPAGPAASALSGAGAGNPAGMRITDTRHLAAVVDPDAGRGAIGQRDLLYRTPLQPSIDGNTVDLDRERASFADNTVRYEATLRFLGSQVRTLTSAIRGE